MIIVWLYTSECYVSDVSYIPVSSSQGTQERQDTEGRNFILRKLCELGLGEVKIMSFFAQTLDQKA